MTDLASRGSIQSKAALCLVLGIATLTIIPVISLITAPCGFPLALVAGISAVTIGRRAKMELFAHGEAASGMISAGVITSWIGMVLNTLIMLLKLSMFVAMFVLPIIAISHGANQK
jgi:hypothetical protein